MKLLNFIVIAAVCGVTYGVPSIEEYLEARGEIRNAEDSRLLGGSMRLDDPREQLVNTLLMQFKEREYVEGVDSNGQFFAGSQHFFHTKPRIEESNVFRIIKMMPKGGNLHMHDTTVGDVHFIANNLTRGSDLIYYCVQGWDHLMFHWFPEQPTELCNGKDMWRKVSDLRKNASSEGWVDNWFLASMSMETPVPETTYPDTNIAWNFFEKKIDTITSVVNYEETAKANYYQILQQHYDDNVMYAEMRGLLTGVYRLNQSELTPLQILTLFKEAHDQFVEDHPDFWGGKYIYAPHRFRPGDEVQELIENAIVMKEAHPDYFAGFDLVGQEDKGTPLLGFLPQLLNAAERNVRFFFHSGETDWHGTKIDENLIDATLLNTTRFGHGYALFRHPIVMEMAKEKGIAAEVCPISNQVLRLVEDLRNHPSTNYFRDQYPVVVSSDGPGMWGAAPLSHDWYMAFMAISGQHSDLRFLKQLAHNSINYSAMSAAEKASAMSKWEVQWDTFLNNVIQQFSHLSDSPMANTVY